ncbi:hypothetical protein DA717_11835 [Piscirickettsiaceae bacterium NZ-RLO2]|uniref:DUF2612 domain-containing protein n=1 Tax=Piscirickettsia salmonis TaxID=1238 RepID=UPI000F087388|nr:hypothetical protein DA717_11835 [Piscirickettsiaceae bacterium NZ-RLO2]
MTTITQIDHNALALSRTLEQFKGKDNYTKLVQVLANALQSSEQTFIDLLTKRYIDNSTGKQLDDVGYDVGCSRNGLKDDDYRRAIYLQIAINTSQGRERDISFVAKQITASSVIQFRENNHGPAQLQVFFDGENATPDNMQLVAQVIGGGIQYYGLTTQGGSPFGFDDISSGFDDGRLTAEFLLN